MRLALRILTIVLLVSGLACAQPAPGEIAYTISLKDANSHRLHVRINLPAGAHKLQLPVWNALYQVRDFAQFVSDISPVGCVQKENSSLWLVRNDCRTIEYDYYAALPGPFGVEASSVHTFINWAELVPYDADARWRPVRVTVLDIPSEWSVRDAGVLCAASGCLPEGTAVNYDKLADTPVEIASMQETSYVQDGAVYHIAVRGNPADYDLEKFTENVQKITAAEVDYMQDRPFDSYTFLYHFPRGPGGGGMEHSYSTAIELNASRLKSDPLSYAGVTAHEFFHLWNVKRIRPRSLEPVDYTREQDSRALWFSEGVTSTVAEHILFRAGLLDETKFLKRLAQQIQELESRPARQWQSVEDSSLETWYDKYPYYGTPERSISYYNKGQILGVLLDLRMRRVSGGNRSLRDLFQYMNRRWAEQGKYFNDSESIRLAAEVLTGDDFKQFFADYVAGTKPLPYDEFESVGLKLERDTIEMADAGFVAGRGVNGMTVVASVEKGSDAVIQGVHVGDVIASMNGNPVTPLQFNSAVRQMRAGEMLHILLRSGSTERELQIKTSKLQVVQLAFKELPNVTAAQRALRQAWMRGDDNWKGAGL